MRFITDEEHEKNLKNFIADTWKEVEKGDRLKALQMLEDRMAQEQGREQPANRRDDEGQGREVSLTYSIEDDGYFDSRYPGYLEINENLLDSNEPGTSYKLMDAVMHEGYHAYEYDVTHDKEVNDRPADETVRQWKENDEIYIQAKDNDTNYISHYFQSKEDEAYNYTHQKMQSYEKYFENDPEYHNYIEKVKAEREEDRQHVQEEIGENYKEKINGEITEQYKDLQVEKLQKTQQEHISINKELSSLKQEQSQVSKEINREKAKADNMEKELSQIKDDRGAKFFESVSGDKALYKLGSEALKNGDLEKAQKYLESSIAKNFPTDTTK